MLVKKPKLSHVSEVLPFIIPQNFIMKIFVLPCIFESKENIEESDPDVLKFFLYEYLSISQVSQRPKGRIQECLLRKSFFTVTY